MTYGYPARQQSNALAMHVFAAEGRCFDGFERMSMGAQLGMPSGRLPAARKAVDAVHEPL